MFHSAVGHRRRTTSDVALTRSRSAKRPVLPISSASQTPPKSGLSHSLSFSHSGSSSSLQEQGAASDVEAVATEGECESEDTNVKRVVLRKHRSDEVNGTRSLAKCLEECEADAMEGFWSRRLSTSKNKKHAAKQAEEKQQNSSGVTEKAEKVRVSYHWNHCLKLTMDRYRSSSLFLWTN